MFSERVVLTIFKTCKCEPDTHQLCDIKMFLLNMTLLLFCFLYLVCIFWLFSLVTYFCCMLTLVVA